MRPPLLIFHSSNLLFPFLFHSPNSPHQNSLYFPSLPFLRSVNFQSLSPRPRPSSLHFKAGSSNSTKAETTTFQYSEQAEIPNSGEDQSRSGLAVDVKEGHVPPYLSVAKLSLVDQAFFLLAFIVCTTSVAFTSLVIAAVPTLYAMGRAATSLSKLADTAREELPSTMAAIRLSGMEISDLTLELNDLSQEIADGVNKSAQAVQAAEAGIRQIGSRAHQQTMSMIEERANLPVISIQPVVAGAAKKTTQAVGQATKTLMNLISRGEFSSGDVDEDGGGGVEF